MKKIFKLIPLLMLLPISLLAQFKNATIGVDGLTCSQCSRSVEMAIKRLDFVKDVDMDLEQTICKVSFKENATIDFGQLAKAVRDAGFSVRTIETIFNFKNEADVNSCWVEKRTLFYPVQENIVPKSSMKILLLGKGMISNAALKEHSIKPKNATPCKLPAKTKVPYYILHP